jgi:glycine betaine/proline transport system substrate-binding protein
MSPSHLSDQSRPSLSRRTLVGGGLAAVAAGADWRGISMGPVVLAQVSLSFYAVTGAVVHAVLQQLGHMVEVREGPHEEMFPLLGEGSRMAA